MKTKDITVKISIEYCSAWNYLPHASSLETELKKHLDLDIELIAGSGGIFEVSCDNIMIFSKKEEGHFPEPNEILARLQPESK